MPYAEPHMLLQFGGNLGTNPASPKEIWNCTLRFHSDVLSAIDTDAVGAGVFQALQDTWRSESCGVSDVAKLTFAKWNRIGTNGRYADLNGSRTFEIVPQSGGHRPVHYNPWQTSLVVTLHTNRIRGLASRGRFFLPTPSAAVDNNTGLLPEDFTLAVAGTWAGFLSELKNVVLGVGSGPIVASKGANNGAGPGAWDYVSAVSVGQRADTMRSRAASVRDVGRLVAVN